MTKDDAIKAIERDAIVAFLRNKAQIHDERSDEYQAKRSTKGAYSHSFMASAFNEMADAIERGEHLPQVPEKA